MVIWNVAMSFMSDYEGISVQKMSRCLALGVAVGAVH